MRRPGADDPRGAHEPASGPGGRGADNLCCPHGVRPAGGGHGGLGQVPGGVARRGSAVPACLDGALSLLRRPRRRLAFCGGGGVLPEHQAPVRPGGGEGRGAGPPLRRVRGSLRTCTEDEQLDLRGQLFESVSLSSIQLRWQAMCVAVSRSPRPPSLAAPHSYCLVARVVGGSCLALSGLTFDRVQVEAAEPPATGCTCSQSNRERGQGLAWHDSVWTVGPASCPSCCPGWLPPRLQGRLLPCLSCCLGCGVHSRLQLLGRCSTSGWAA
jgi:hypothetical protein